MFSELLKDLRAQTGVSQTELAQALGVSNGNVGDWERGRSKPGYIALAGLSRFFGVSADYLLELDCEDVKTSDNLLQYKTEQGLLCDGSPLEADEADLVAMFRLLPEEEREDVFDIVHLKYKRRVERKRESIYWTYKEDKLKRKNAAADDDNQGGIA